MQRKSLKLIIFSSIALLTSIAITTSNPSLAASQTQISQNDRKLPVKLNQRQDGSNRGRPTKRKGMGSRSDCPAANIPLTALIPEDKISKVVEANPKFWFYIPYQPNTIPVGEFVLQDEANNDVYRDSFSIDKGEGIVSISLNGKNLEADKIYQWYFKLYCDRDRLSTQIFVRGWVQRVALQPQQQKQLSSASSPRKRAAFYAQNDIWYSALTELAKLKQANPQNQMIAKYWLQLLNDVGLQEFSDRPIVGNINLD